MSIRTEYDPRTGITFDWLDDLIAEQQAKTGGGGSTASTNPISPPAFEGSAGIADAAYRLDGLPIVEVREMYKTGQISEADFRKYLGGRGDKGPSAIESEVKKYAPPPGTVVQGQGPAKANTPPANIVYKGNRAYVQDADGNLTPAPEYNKNGAGTTGQVGETTPATTTTTALRPSAPPPPPTYDQNFADLAELLGAENVSQTGNDQYQFGVYRPPPPMITDALGNQTPAPEPPFNAANWMQQGHGLELIFNPQTGKWEQSNNQTAIDQGASNLAYQQAAAEYNANLEPSRGSSSKQNAQYDTMSLVAASGGDTQAYKDRINAERAIQGLEPLYMADGGTMTTSGPVGMFRLDPMTGMPAERVPSAIAGEAGPERITVKPLRPKMMARGGSVDAGVPRRSAVPYTDEERQQIARSEAAKQQEQARIAAKPPGMVPQYRVGNTTYLGPAQPSGIPVSMPEGAGIPGGVNTSTAGGYQARPVRPGAQAAAFTVRSALMGNQRIRPRRPGMG